MTTTSTTTTAAQPVPEKERDRVDDILRLSALREEGRKELLDVLDAHRGRKEIVADSSLIAVIAAVTTPMPGSSSNAATNDSFSSVPNGMPRENLAILKENGVSSFKELSLTSTTQSFPDSEDWSVEGRKRDSPDHIIYFVRPNLSMMKLVSQQIKAIYRLGLRSKLLVCFVPAPSTVCMHLLEEQINGKELFEKISFGECRLGFVPFDSDMLSLEMDSVFKQCYVDGDLTSLNQIAMSLLKLQTTYGTIPNIRSKGLGAKKVLQKMFKLRLEEVLLTQLSQLTHTSLQAVSQGSRGSKAPHRQDIDTLVILDREVDLVSPLVTPLTYEGLMDEIIGITNNTVRLDSSVLGGDELQKETNINIGINMANAADILHGSANASATSKSKKLSGTEGSAQPQTPVPPAKTMVTLTLTNNDSVFADIRNLSIEKLGSYMQEKAIHIRERYTAFRENKDASLTEIHDFVKKMPKLTKDYKSLNEHINIAALVKTKTDTKEFRSQWQGERGMLEGESFLDAIEEMLYSDVDCCNLNRILRLFCLQSLTSGGVRSNKYDVIRRAIVQNYGYQHVFTLSNLERSGLLKKKDTMLVDTSVPVWQTLRKNLRLIDERINMASPDDISYVSAGYAPLLVRLVQALALNNNSWQHLSNSAASVQESLRLLPGPLHELSQSSANKAEDFTEAVARSALETSSSTSNSSSYGATALTPAALFSYTTGILTSAGTLGGPSSSGASTGMMDSEEKYQRDLAYGGSNFEIGLPSGEKKVMLVVVVGGLSYLEIAAFRFLSRDPAFPFRIVMAATKFVSGSSFISSMHHIV